VALANIYLDSILIGIQKLFGYVSNEKSFVLVVLQQAEKSSDKVIYSLIFICI